MEGIILSLCCIGGSQWKNDFLCKLKAFTFRIVNFPHMDSNIPANPAYGVYISQLVRYSRIMNRLRGLSLRGACFGFSLVQKLQEISI